DCSSWNNEVVAILKINFSIKSFQHAASFVNKNQFIGIGILEEVICNRFLRSSKRNLQIVIYKNRFFAFDIIILCIYLKSAKAMMFQQTLMRNLGLARKWFAGFFY